MVSGDSQKMTYCDYGVCSVRVDKDKFDPTFGIDGDILSVTDGRRVYSVNEVGDFGMFHAIVTRIIRQGGEYLLKVQQVNIEELV